MAHGDAAQSNVRRREKAQEKGNTNRFVSTTSIGQIGTYNECERDIERKISKRSGVIHSCRQHTRVRHGIVS